MATPTASGTWYEYHVGVLSKKATKDVHKDLKQLDKQNFRYHWVMQTYVSSDGTSDTELDLPGSKLWVYSADGSDPSASLKLPSPVVGPPDPNDHS